MTKRKFLMALMCAAIAVLVSCGGSSENKSAASAAGSTQATQKITMKISHVSAPGSARDLGCKKIEEVVESMTGGAVDGQVYPASQLGGQRDQVEGAQFGTIECVVVPTSYLGGIAPMMTLLDTPFLLPEDPEDLYKLYQSDAVRKLMDTTLEKGIYTMAIWQTGYKAWSANKPLLDPKGMRGLKVRVMNSPILFEQARVLGATGITMDFGETYGALQNKTLDGQENPIDTIYDMKFHEVQTDITFTNHSGLDQVVMFNKAWFDGLSADIQKAIGEGVKQGGRVCLEQTLALAKKDKELILATGKTALHELNDAQKGAWRAATAPVQEFARAKMGAEGAALYDGIVAARKAITGK
ncbi:MAG: TRAP transporter substrate-binding protein [Spirochaetia bacterium]|jgi:C4-dicarboxylate-binding protein DctP|nr:TRAP transporter substrate-binding protein [Spirochaetia bacterium]